MKAVYRKPTFVRRDMLSRITADIPSGAIIVNGGGNGNGGGGA
jgi:hypothetical protein